MWKGKKIGWLAVLLFLCWSWYASGSLVQKLSGYDNTIYIQTQEDAVTARAFSQKIAQLQNAEISIPQWLLWKREEGQMVSGTWQRQASGQIIRYLGNPDLLYTEQMLLGSWPINDQGCVVDTKLADQLWGSTQVLGQILTCGGRSYTVTGVLPDAGAVGYLPESAEGEGAFSHLLLDMTGQLPGVYGASQVLQQMGISSQVCYDYGLWTFAAACIHSLSGCVLWLYLLVQGIRLLRKLTAAPILMLLGVAGVLLSLAVLGWCVGFPSVPEALIPSRWSDFSFWSEQMQQLTGSLNHFLTDGGAQWEISFWTDLAKCALLSGGSLVLLGFGLERWKPCPLRTIYVTCAGWWAGLLLLSIQNSQSVYAVPELGVWLTVPVFLGLSHGLRTFQNWLFAERKEDACQDASEEPQIPMEIS